MSGERIESLIPDPEDARVEGGKCVHEHGVKDIDARIDHSYDDTVPRCHARGGENAARRVYKPDTVRPDVRGRIGTSPDVRRALVETRFVPRTVFQTDDAGVGSDTLEVIQTEETVRETLVFVPGGGEPLTFDL